MLQEKPNLDSLCGLFLMKKTALGEKQFPGAKDAKIVFWPHGTISPDGKTWKDYEAEGCISIGILGGNFDEHPSPECGDGKARGDSTTSLIAECIGAIEHPWFKKLISSVTRSDLGEDDGKDRMLGLAHIIKEMFRDMVDPQDVIKFAFSAFEAIVAGQQRFDNARKVICVDRRGKVCKFDNGLRVLGIESDNCQTGPASRCCGFAVTVQWRNTGHAMVLVDQNRIPLEVSIEIARAIRTEELIAQGCDGVVEGDFAAPGQIVAVPNWCLQIPGGNILNGTETAPGVKASVIDQQRLFDIVCDQIEKITREQMEQLRLDRAAATATKKALKTDSQQSKVAAPAAS
jgi:hypothetical protein